MFKRTINFEIVKTPKEDTLTPKKPIDRDDVVYWNAVVIANVQNAAVGFVAVYAAIKAIDTASKIAVIKAVK